MKVLALVVLLVVSTMAVRLQKGTMNKVIEELQKTKYGSALYHMVQLHSLAQGPVQELLDAVEELISDLNTALEELEFDFQRRTSEHNADVISLNQDIQDASIDIDRADDVIQNLLVPRRQQLKSRIAQVRDNQDENRKQLAESTLVREQDHEAYELQVEDLNSATAAVDEALALLETLSNPSLLQIKKFQNSLKKVDAKINKRGKLAPMIKALISLAANQNFSNQDIIRDIVGALNEFRSEVVNSLNDLTAAEAENQADYEDHVNQLNLDFAEFQRQIVNITTDLTAVEDKLEQTYAFQKARQVDLKAFEAQLELENTQYAEETEIYTDLKNEYLREIAVSEQALSLVSNADLHGIVF